jgi:L-alanine-DL-glutamate epimerase-like enolase superfamily enzyme
MQIRWQAIELETRLPFVTAHGGGRRFGHVLVEVEHEGTVGHGEASPARYHGEDQRTVLAALETLAPAACTAGDPAALDAIHAAMAAALAGHHAARSAIDVACHDWLGHRLGIPLWRLLGVERERIPPSSYTVAIGAPDTVPAALEAARAFRILKIKMGDAGDAERLAAVRGATGRPLRVDANGGWTVAAARARLDELVRAGVELLEQPVAVADVAGLGAVRARASLPIVADEPACVASDLPALVGHVDGVNVKLAKCGGIRPALAMIHAARACGLSVMLGCMVESSIGIGAAAALSPLADWVDLDGHCLLARDLATGLELTDGRVLPSPDSPGLGLTIDPSLAGGRWIEARRP